MRTFSAVIAVLVSTVGFVQVAAADAGDNLSVTASVASTCTITGNTLAFGAYNTVSGAAVNGSATIAVACTTGTDTFITLDQGAHAAGGSSADAPLRRMSDGGANFLAYSLFSDSNRSIVWGGTSNTSADYLATSSAPANMTVYGRIAASQDVPAGSYTDTVLATIAF